MILGVNGIRLVRKRSGVARAIEAILNALAIPSILPSRRTTSS